MYHSNQQMPENKFMIFFLQHFWGKFTAIQHQEQQKPCNFYPNIFVNLENKWERVDALCTALTLVCPVRYCVGLVEISAVLFQLIVIVDSRSGPTHLVVTFRLMARPARQRNHPFFVKTKYWRPLSRSKGETGL